MSWLTIQDFVERGDQQVALLKRLVEIESPSTDKAAVDRVGALVAEEARRLGATVTLDAQTLAGDNVIAQWDPAPEAGTGLLLLCHMDTVYDLGALARQPCVEKDGKLMGPGTVDMKASIAMVLTALRALRDTNRYGRPARAGRTA